MKREILKELGLEDTIIDKIMDENGKDINKSNEKIKTLEAEVNNTKELLTNANKEIDSYKSIDIDVIKKYTEDYKTKFETAEKDYQAKLSQMEYDNKLDKYVGTLNLKNYIYKKEVISIIKEKELKFDGDTLLGGEELYFPNVLFYGIIQKKKYMISLEDYNNDPICIKYRNRYKNLQKQARESNKFSSTELYKKYQIDGPTYLEKYKLGKITSEEFENWIDSMKIRKIEKLKVQFFCT